MQKIKENPKVPIIINTSFNLRGEPIVHRPEEAIVDYLKTEMDVLVLGEYMLKKENKKIGKIICFPVRV